MLIRVAPDQVGSFVYDLPDVTIPAWHENGACNRDDVDPEWWFPDRGASSEAAKVVCLTCPVREKCLEHAVEAETFGIWRNQ